MAIQLFTIGFTKKNAEIFFGILRAANVRRIIDVRLNNSSQLAGFTKKDDLRFFLRELCDADYCHFPQCSPTKEILDAYKKKQGSWEEYVASFLPLIKERQIEDILTPDILNRGCFLCSEPTSEKCHRRLVAEYIQVKYPEVEITHL